MYVFPGLFLFGQSAAGNGKLMAMLFSFFVGLNCGAAGAQAIHGKVQVRWYDGMDFANDKAM